MAERKKELSPGTLVGDRYEVFHKIGEGSFSTVYRVLDRQESVERAIKVLHKWSGLDRELVERFRREVHYSQRVVHEGCCKVFDFHEYPDMTVLVMELVEGWTLDVLIEKLKPLPLEVVFSWIGQASSSVAGLHRKDIIHRDIKAENMMVNRNGRLKILDLGLSWSSELSSLTAVGSVLGTPAYMAPELIESGVPSPKTDVYALGALSYMMLAGHLPFRAPELARLLAMHIAQKPVSLLQHRPDLDPRVDELILRCLAKDPLARPANAGALEEAWIATMGKPYDPAAALSILATMDLPVPEILSSPEPVSDPRLDATEVVDHAEMVLKAIANPSPFPEALKQTFPVDDTTASLELERESATFIVPLLDLPPELQPNRLKELAAAPAQPIAAPVADMTAIPEEGPQDDDETDPRIYLSGEVTRRSRRRLVLLLGVLAVGLVAAGGVLGVLLLQRSPRGRAMLEAFRRGLRELFGG